MHNIYTILIFLFFSTPAEATPWFQSLTGLEIFTFRSGNVFDGNDPALAPVTKEFGPSRISLSALPFESPLAEAESKPWSSWRFPRVDASLFRGGGAVLEKHDEPGTA